MPRMECPAPLILVESWLRGPTLTKFQPRKMYVVELWAIGCASCVAAMTNVAQLQERYKDRSIEVVGAAAHERAATSDETRTKLHTWLTEKFSNQNYRIGSDYTGEMNRLWMKARVSVRIPSPFVVD